jgi:UDP-glucose 4-epimerase
MGSLEVLVAAGGARAWRVVFCWSGGVYGDDPRSPKTEDMMPSPKSPYGITKLDGEFYLRMYAEMHGVPTVSLRYFNVFGPRQDPKSMYAAAVPIFIHRALANEKITVFGDGEQTRDFVFVEDVARANMLAAESARVGHGEVFNVAQGGRITINDLVARVCEFTASRSVVEHAPERPGDIKHSQASIARIREALAFEPSVGLDEGLRRTIAEARSPR